MVGKLSAWLVLLLAFKMAAVLLVEQFYTDPRRDVNARHELCRAYKPNVVFIGTSRTLFGIDPAIFDSLNQQKTRSYNFGIFSLSPQTSIQIAEDIVSKSAAVRTIYIELSALDYGIHALEPQDVIPDAIFRMHVIADCSEIDLSDKINAFFKGLNATLLQMLSIAPQITVAKKIFVHNPHPIQGDPELRDNGHQSVSLALSETLDRTQSHKIATSNLFRKRPTGSPNTYFVSKIRKLITHAQQRGVKVIFFIGNNISQGEYQILSQVAPFLPEENLIRLPAQLLLTEFFEPENMFDRHHLNQKGAAIYTRFLQEESSKRP
ncbi:hypothetical protein DYBT9623_04655 [Dyadobacter sp. CECT 9623]|uniref:Uncharacterized protein n=1 Tax=Dyadobacter linearis TaxID=2823330 RepID=A0ABN7RH99_9BACT|nr:hypothetical protein [Dyadobacter sp. CECT 9623]CAG5073151.1 hypothetical protein DYBT9623_04655 [Dyadobacter sp. CECT 9623]